MYIIRNAILDDLRCHSHTATFLGSLPSNREGHPRAPLGALARTVRQRSRLFGPIKKAPRGAALSAVPAMLAVAGQSRPESILSFQGPIVGILVGRLQYLIASLSLAVVSFSTQYGNPNLESRGSLCRTIPSLS